MSLLSNIFSIGNQGVVFEFRWPQIWCTPKLFGSTANSYRGLSYSSNQKCFFKKTCTPLPTIPMWQFWKVLTFLIRYQYLSKQTSKQLLFQDNKLTFNLYLSNKRFSRYLYWSRLGLPTIHATTYWWSADAKRYMYICTLFTKEKNYGKKPHYKCRNGQNFICWTPNPLLLTLHACSHYFVFVFRAAGLYLRLTWLTASAAVPHLHVHVTERYGIYLAVYMQEDYS